MSDVLTVQTAFGDIADLAQGYIGRVNARQIVVLTAEPVEPGQVVRFQVLLGDGTLAFWGDGHCAQANDLGDEAEPHARYELLLHSLEFPDERSLPVFDYMVSMSDSATPSEELTASEEGVFPEQESATAEIETGEMEALDAQAPPTIPPVESIPPMESMPPMESVPPVESMPPMESVPPVDAFAAQAEDEDELAPMDVAPEMHAEPQMASVPPVDAFAAQGEDEEGLAPIDMAPEMHDEPARVLSDRPGPPPGGVLTRLSAGNAWRPAAPAKRQPAARSGLFKYPFGPLPKPSRPPRPEIDPSARVTLAPRPTASQADA